MQHCESVDRTQKLPRRVEFDLLGANSTNKRVMPIAERQARNDRIDTIFLLLDPCSVDATNRFHSKGLIQRSVTTLMPYVKWLAR